MTSPWELVLAAPARRALERLPEKIVGAILDFMVERLVQNPRRLGKEVGGELPGLYSARVGAYRIVYEIDEERRLVQVYRIDHRADVYRPR